MNDYLITDSELILKLKSKEISLNLKTLRLACPCANCKGEKDVFGNVYKGNSKPLNIQSFEISFLKKVGNYALQIFWRDNHKDGIYTFDFLKNISE